MNGECGSFSITYYYLLSSSYIFSSIVLMAVSQSVRSFDMFLTYAHNGANVNNIHPTP